LHTITEAMTDAIGLSGRDSACGIVPMFHAMGWGLPFAAMMLGAKQVMPHRFLDARHLLGLFESEEVTISAGVPTIWQSVRSAIEAEPDRWYLSKLRCITCGSAPPLSLIRWYWETLGIEMVQAWGMTETNPLGTLTRMCSKRSHRRLTEEQRFANVAKAGLLMPGLEMEIVDESFQPVPHDGVAMGELLVRGPWVCSEYYKDPQPDKFHDGWLVTGDVARIDPEQYLIIADRSKDLVKSGGEWISSVDLENHIVGMRGIAMATVVAQPHPKWEERPVALVVPSEGSAATAEEVIAHCAKVFAKWQLPDDVLFREALPLISTGKIDKKALRAELAAEGYLPRHAAAEAAGAGRTPLLLEDPKWQPRFRKPARFLHQGRGRRLLLGAAHRVNRAATIPYRHLSETGRIDAWKPTGGRKGRCRTLLGLRRAKWIEAAAYGLAAHPDPELEGGGCGGRPDRSRPAAGRLPEHLLHRRRTREALRQPRHVARALLRRTPDRGGGRPPGGHRQAQAPRRGPKIRRPHRFGLRSREEGRLPRPSGDRARPDQALPRDRGAPLPRAGRLLPRSARRQALVLPARGEEARSRGQPAEPPLLRRGRGFRTECCQDHLPVREQSDAVGHAVRAMYLYCAMADVAAETGDGALLRACKRLWRSVCERRMYVTGGIGPASHNEGFTADYDLPNASAYAETCAAIGLVFWSHRLLQLEGDGRYADAMERALYNGVASGVSLDGERFFYVNPLASRGDAHRQPWFACSCCPPNVARLVASFGQYVYSESSSEAWVHLYVQGRGSSISVAAGS
jgi:hypothetical protein